MLRNYIRLLLEKNAAEKRGVDLDKMKEDKIEKYTSSRNYFVSYTQLDKVGINPKSPYDTPIGVYTYPLIDLGRDGLTGKVPYQGQQPYMQIIYSDMKGIVEVDKNGAAMENDDRWRYVALKILDKFNEDFSFIYRDIDKIIASMTKAVEDQEYGWGLEKYVAEALALTVQAYGKLQKSKLSLKKLAAYEKEVGWITERMYEEVSKYMDDPEEDYDAEINQQTKDLMHAYKAASSNFDYIFEKMKLIADEETSISTHFIKNTKYRTGFGLFWNATRLLAENPKRWARILVKFGVKGVVDHGSGLIHEHEPTQAVFMDARSYKHVDTLANPKLGYDFDEETNTPSRKYKYVNGAPGNITIDHLGQTSDGGKIISKKITRGGSLFADEDKPSEVIIANYGRSNRILASKWHFGDALEREDGPAVVDKEKSRLEWHYHRSAVGIYDQKRNVAVFAMPKEKKVSDYTIKTLEYVDYDSFVNANERIKLMRGQYTPTLLSLFEKDCDVDALATSDFSEELAEELAKKNSQSVRQRVRAFEDEIRDGLSKERLAAMILSSSEAEMPFILEIIDEEFEVAMNAPEEEEIEDEDEDEEYLK